MNLKSQILDKVNSVNKDHVKPKVLAPRKYVIDVELIVPRLRNNKEAHFDYLSHLKESVETIRDIVEEAKVVRPLDRSLVSACRYTNHSQKLLEYAIGTCPQDSHQRDKKLAHAPLISKKQVTFVEPCDTSNSNTHKHVAQVNTHKTNVPVPPSTVVNCYTNASGSQPRSNTKKNRISLAKGVNMLQVEEQPRRNKYHLRTSNHVDSSSRLKRTDNFMIHILKLHSKNSHVTLESTINDLARKDLVRGSPRLKFEKDHLCSACQLGKSKKSCCYCLLHPKQIPNSYLSQQTLYELSYGKKPNLTFLCVFGFLCYLTNDNEDLGKLKAKVDIGIFVGYAPNRKGYSIYNKRTRWIMETIHIQFDEMTEHMALVHISTGLESILMTSGQISSGLVPNLVLAATYVPPTNKDLEILFQPMFDEYFEPPSV
nr:hypothetical protein [Tanacetum cinerariifolium]